MTALNEVSELWSTQLVHCAEVESASADDPEDPGPNCCWVICDICCWVKC